MTSHPTEVFIVDDSAQIRTRLAQMLSAMEHVRLIGEADCALEAIGHIRRLRPDCVLLDLNLLGRSGLEVLRAIHAESPGIAFIVLTNHSEPQYRSACMEAGARYFLDKSSEFERVPELVAGLAPQQ
jgi:DNA-binding NarL/FixJ family response regulator